MAAISNRRQPTRSVRSTASRPSNYYAKPFSYRNAGPGPLDNEPLAPATPGFFPAITHFTDSISALPKEVQRHFTMMKETEGKAYQPDQSIAELVTAIRKLPDAPRMLAQDHHQSYMQFSMGNSLNGSVNGFVFDGSTPHGLQSIVLPEGSSLVSQPADEHQERRLDLFSKLKDQVREMTSVLDEKNMVLAAANEALTRQLSRVDSSLPYIDNEISEDARLGSNTHWALPHMKDMRRTSGGGAQEKTRRDVTNVNNLAAAAAAVHEGEIAATRSEARREAMLAKRGRGHNFDSDFDDRAPTRRQPTAAKSRKAFDASGSAPNGGVSHKRRRVEKVKGTSVERSLGAALNNRLGSGRPSPRDIPAVDAVSRKRAKPLPGPAPRKKIVPVDSPSMTSSPSRATFPTIRNQSPAAGPSRNATARSRISSNASLLQDAARKRPASAQSSRTKQQVVSQQNAKSYPINKQIGAPSIPEDSEPQEMVDSRDQLPDDAKSGNDYIDVTIDGLDGVLAVKRERTDPPEMSASTIPGAQAQMASSSKSSIAQAVGKSSKPATPTHNIFTDLSGPAMSRSRSVRGANQNGSTTTNGSPRLPASVPSPRRSHKKGASQSSVHVDSTARSPVVAPGEQGTSRRPKRNDTRKIHVDADIYDEGINDTVAEDMPYCFCKKPSEGEMIGCDNEECPTEWFHMECVGLSKAPVNEWFCTESCRKHQHSKV